MSKQTNHFSYSLINLFLYFLKLGALGFGGAISLANTIHKDLVKKHKWITEDEFKHGLAFIQFSPGPLISQLSMYIGFLKGNVLGATIAIIAFLIPSFIVVLLISIFYVQYGDIPAIRGALYGISAAIVGIIAMSAYSLTRKTVTKPLLWGIVAIIFLISFFSGSVNFLFFIGAGILSLFVYAKPKKNVFSLNYMPLIIIPAISSSSLIKLFIFFVSAGSLAFGGGFAILPYLQNGVVNQYHWLTNKQFLDAVAVAMITPGPLVITSVFIGYLVARLPGALIATFGIFLPAYLIVIFLTPILRKHINNIYLKSFTSGVIAAAMGAIAGALVTLGKESITDYFTALCAVGAIVTTKFLKIHPIFTVVIAGILGVLFFHAH